MNLTNIPIEPCPFTLEKCIELQQAVSGKANLYIAINIISLIYLAVMFKLFTWGKIDSERYIKWAAIGYIPLIISSVFLLDVALRGLL